MTLHTQSVGLLGAALLFATSLFATSSVARFPSYDPHFPPPPGPLPPGPLPPRAEVFELSQDYPAAYREEAYPWLDVDPFSAPERYMRAVLAYALAGNVAVDFAGQRNPIRKWYHSPWLHDDSLQATSGRPGNGREYVHGLTRERATPPYEIHRDQDVALENWAVSLYNAPGGYTLARVWRTETGVPEPRNATFPEGTVAFKLLFTDGPVEKLPFLEGTLAWTANVYDCNPRAPHCRERKNRTVRLLQLDMAVKDRRARKTGWFFGTFMYDASARGKSVWERMVPVGLSWGDDQVVFSRMNEEGAFVNEDLEETYLNVELMEDPSRHYTNQAYVRHHGLGGRLNGPVDDPISSCISCHAQAGVSKSGRTLPVAAFHQKRISYPSSEFIRYFSTVRPGVYVRPFQGETYVSTDYSLQIAGGIRNYHQSLALQSAESDTGSGASSGPASQVGMETSHPRPLPPVTRGE